ncbi:uncharacterized protein LOC108906213 [Anoplophora glabripennis]|uniref:uncharacterized protein LOC108906213 n=1 Tax=Anoplophora glabripennis TaxID=217634 RepID=UPI0008743F38|nr:uncharacterized protein LOC108906213 [Anoplophora glabripennis]
MSRLLVLLVATLFVCVIAEEGSFNITQGYCNTALAKDMVYREHVYKYFIPLVERNATSSWYGDEKVYCVMALNENDESQGGVAFIKEGGFGHHFVTIEMHSKRGNTLEYDVQIYGK